MRSTALVETTENDQNDNFWKASMIRDTIPRISTNKRFDEWIKIMFSKFIFCRVVRKPLFVGKGKEMCLLHTCQSIIEKLNVLKQWNYLVILFTIYIFLYIVSHTALKMWNISIYDSLIIKQEGHNGPGSLTLIIQCTAMQNTSRQLFWMQPPQC